jgi:hypothetical protein
MVDIIMAQVDGLVARLLRASSVRRILNESRAAVAGASSCLQHMSNVRRQGKALGGFEWREKYRGDT